MNSEFILFKETSNTNKVHILNEQLPRQIQIRSVPLPLKGYHVLVLRAFTCSLLLNYDCTDDRHKVEPMTICIYNTLKTYIHLMKP